MTRPVRQGRLKLALEEVLSMTVDTPTSRSAPSTLPHMHAPTSLATMCHHIVVSLQTPSPQQLHMVLSGLHSLDAALANAVSKGRAMPLLRLPQEPV